MHGMRPQEDIFAKIQKLKRERNAVILAHYYQEPDIQDIADFIGDSLGLSQEAAKTNADVILFAGVHFMAETAKIINPKKKVLLPDLEAGCSLADACPVDEFKKFKAKYPDHVVVSYVNCSAAVKAESDYICTSSNAVKIVNAIPKDKKIIFAPDRNLGRYVIQQTGRDMVLWNGACIVHETFSEKKLVQLKVEHPDALVIAHPECEKPVLDKADFIGSTTALLNFSLNNPAKKFIVVTEAGIIHQMQKAAPGKIFIPSPPNANCACNECPYMRRNTLEKVLAALENMSPEIQVEESVRKAAWLPIEKMLEISK
jgi:quinolinate synthase